MSKEEQLKLLIHQRGIIKSQATRFKTFVTKLVQDGTGKSQLRVRLEKFEAVFEKFTDIQTEIEFADESGQQEAERKLFEDSFYELVSQAQEILASESASLVQDSTPSRSTATNSNSTNSMQIRLPVLSLPTFSGEYDQWLLYKDSFKSLIDTYQDLSETQKFQYLRGSLKGEALQVIHSLESSQANYQIAWDLLEKRYENKHLIIHNHMKALFELPTVIKDNFQSLRALLDNVQKHTRALKTLEEPVDKWNTILIYLISHKLDFHTKREWEINISSKSDDTMPSLSDFIEFLTNKCQILSMIEKTSDKPNQNNYKSQSVKSKTQVMSHVATTKVCSVCKGSHQIYTCETFLNMSTPERIEQVKKSKLCYNCLNPNHVLAQCQAGNCRTCNKKHNTLIHVEKVVNNQPIKNNQLVENNQQVTLVNSKHLNSSVVLLSTAVVYAETSKYTKQEMRVLLDSGSQSNFITKEACDKLGLKPHPVSIPVTGISGSKTFISQQVTVTISSRVSSFQTKLNCLVIPKITENIPLVSINSNAIKVPSNLRLADPKFLLSSRVDMLIGAEIFIHLLCAGRISTGTNLPVFQKTHLGWIASGVFSPILPVSTSSACHISLDASISKFWEIEEIGDKPALSIEEQQCEEYFQSTVKRDRNGRFVVKLPFNENKEKLGESRITAVKRFEAAERRMQNTNIKQQYIEFMEEYEALNHMVEVSNPETINKGYYLPHHTVLKSDSVTTKLRVVFDGSSKTSTGVSLNEALMKGPTVQDELFAIMLRFRTHALVMTADLTKMYRQVKVDDEDSNYQLIVWRKDPNDQLRTYKLVTVTYGTTSAPFLATRCLNQLAAEEEISYPLASAVVKRDFYVDDLLTGTQTLEEAYLLRDQLTNLLKAGGFEIRKWRSNSADFLTNTQLLKPQDPVLTLDKDKNFKTLGLLWNSDKDTLLFCINIAHDSVTSKIFTKRKILSTIAQIFDPLGLLGPIITVAKIIMQQLWQLQVNWDDPAPADINNRWIHFYKQLKYLNELNIERRITNLTSPSIELHAFCDASQAAYGVCIYIQSTDQEQKKTSRLICSKSRVAPIKTITLPRLELCGALLAARLVQKVKSSMLINFIQTYFWTDSTVVLSWLQAPANTWSTFVSNRVAEIQTSTNISQWHHVAGKTNPADGLSRGKMPSDILEDRCWWEGPSWLLEDKSSWPNEWQQTQSDFNLEKRKSVLVHVAVAFTQKNKVIKDCSTLLKLQRIVAYILRFKNNALNRQHKLKGPLTVNELEKSLWTIVKVVQQESFLNEIEDLSKGHSVHSKSILLPLNPFLDKNKVLRVGGRLQNSALNYEQKHPAILNKNHHFTKLLVQYYHNKLMHAGAQSVLASIRNRFWIVAGRSYVKKILRQCITCFKANPRPLSQIMGNLPKERTQITNPFYHTGIDYGGPMFIKQHYGRGRVQTRKCYIAVFVCFATKAVHIELVADLTKEAFINALKRFIARRGGCSKLFSDNATNFVGANRELRELYEMLAQEETNNAIQNTMSFLNVSWVFIPPRSPHMGGLWEAAIKSVKYHINRVIGNTVLTFEEYNTILTQIESCLNSRPLIPITSNPDDLTALTPFHFLLGSSFAGLPERDLTDMPINKLSRWQHVMKIKQDIWKRWSTEYVVELQRRNKWKTPSRNITEGDLVIIIDDLKSSLHWPLGRVTTVHPGKDGFIRVATVKTTNGLTKKAITKLCLLPQDDIERPTAFQGDRNVPATEEVVV